MAASKQRVVYVLPILLVLLAVYVENLAYNFKLVEMGCAKRDER